MLGILILGNGFDIGINYQQFPLYKLAPEYINIIGESWWLRTISSDSTY